VKTRGPPAEDTEPEDRRAKPRRPPAVDTAPKDRREKPRRPGVNTLPSPTAKDTERAYMIERAVPPRERGGNTRLYPATEGTEPTGREVISEKNDIPESPPQK
jgi:hypothetical protein